MTNTDADDYIGSARTMSSSAAAGTAAPSIRLLKRQLRRQMSSTLASVAPASLAAQSAQVAARILASPTYTRAQRVCVYVNTDTSEVRTDDICRSVLLQQKELYVPRFATEAGVKGAFENDMKMLRIRDWADFEIMVRNRWGIREPEIDGRQDALDESTGGQGLDLILAPGVAFDVQGGRLGHGKGYYDRYLARADAFARETGAQLPTSVALSLEEQILPPDQRVPADEDDRTLDAIVHPGGVFHTTRRWQEG
ncbi:5-formyltetrahydrofolate cyclo-ligase [Acaromyces ingoldii]|uniref:5-formyltetrahydrofolate cyclo-ligase n=1 Tax=Acaromyces ingoldii TaxID=215250 RepID=A0A316YXW1_9BASI|nr:5-formyltetrahydrofolate cyclo-ligase [Acaromyces ingoldii]PWN94031.1 5-formyltetrahydrofolate cyclo-ligase [Acaromyces ingoldii]